MKKRVLSTIFLLTIFSLHADVIDMSRFWDYSEIEDSLFAWAGQHSGLAQVESIGTTNTDQLPIWAIKISDNVELNEDEPAILFVGTCHAEEVMGTELVMDNIREILLNQNTAPFSYWLNDLEIWFVPTMNPEGMRVVMGFYEDNEEVFPSQVGEWVQDVSYRKNRTDTNNNNLFDIDPEQWGYDLDGVDPNRNYPFNWVHGDTLYSNNGTQLYDYYRGPYPLSEGGTQAIDFLTDREKIVFSIHWHSSRTGSICQTVYYPYRWHGYRESPDIDFAQHLGLGVGNELLTENGELYEVYAGSGRRGSEEDYLYKEYGTIQLLIEAGNEEIQPDSVIMQEQIQRTKLGTYWMLNRALRFQYDTDVDEHSMLTGHIYDSETGAPIAAEIIVNEHNAEYLSPRKADEEYGRFWRPLLPGLYSVTVRKKGYVPATFPGVVINSSTWSEHIINLDPATEYVYNGTITNENGDSLNGYILDDYMGIVDTIYFNNGLFDFDFYEGEHKIEIIVEDHIPFKGTWSIDSNNYNMEIMLSTEYLEFEENFESGTGNWDIEGPWVLINDSQASYEINSITDSWGGKGFYDDECDVHISTATPIPIPETDHAILSFMSSRYTESVHDSVMVQISTYESEWNTVWSGTGQYEDWNLEIINLDEYLGEDIYIRFRLKDHSPVPILVDTGWTLDNIKVISGYYEFVDSNDDIVPFLTPNIVLNNNYPNPFNPETTFSFDIENIEVKSASISVYNIKGQEVKKFILNQGEIQSGFVKWNAKSQSSGVYFYKLDVNNKNYGIKKAILLK